MTVKARPEAELGEFVGRLFSMRSASVRVRSRQGTFSAATIPFVQSRHLPAGVLEERKNYVVLDGEGNVVSLVLRDVYGEETRQYIHEVCEECFELRVAGRRGAGWEGGGAWSGISYTVSTSPGKFFLP